MRILSRRAWLATLFAAAIAAAQTVVPDELLANLDLFLDFELIEEFEAVDDSGADEPSYDVKPATFTVTTPSEEEDDGNE